MKQSCAFNRNLALAVGSALALAGLASSAQATIRFLGIGNDEFRMDIDTSYDKLAGCLTARDTERRVTQQDHDGILAELTAIKMAAQPGDILFIHYSGHGGTEASAEPGDAVRGIIGTSPDSGATFPAPANDTEIANLINMIAIGVNVVTIFDSCFAGEMVDDPATDITRGMILGTSDATCVAPGGSIFLPLWCEAFEDLDLDGIPDGDTNGDGMLTLGELWGVLGQIETQGHNSNPYATDFGGNNSDAVIWVPAPATLATLGLLLLAPRRARRN